MKYLPQITRVKNEIVWWLAFIVGIAQFLITQINEPGVDNVNDVYGLIVVLLGFVQRSQAFGKETVAEIIERYEDE